MHNPFFSVIVPTHNGETFIRNCLRSIKTQSYRNYELLVVCDSCDDFTWEVAKRFTHPDNIYFTECHHDGLTRNKGLDNAQGDWILFADDDDWFLHEFAFEMLAEQIQTDPETDVIAFGFIWKDVGYAKPIRDMNGIRSFYPAVWNKAYKRSFIDTLRFKPIQNSLTEATDKDWTNRLLAMSPQIATFDQPLYYYNYLRPGSQTAGFMQEGGANDS